jgi:uncharacterized protein with FMN-binding domain
MAEGDNNPSNGAANNPSGKKVANGLVAASCAAVIAVYSAGYVRTKAAVDHFEAQAAERRAAFPDPNRIVDRVDGPHSAMRTEAATATTFDPRPPRESTREHKHFAPAPPPPPDPPPLRSAEAPPSALPEIPSPVSFIPDAPAIPAPAAAAGASVEAVAPPPPAAKWKDGTYLGWGTSRHGNIQAEVIVEGGRIASATIAQCRTRYSCSVIDKLPPQVAQRQSPDVDYVSGATQSANAFYFAVVEALGKAQ